MITSLNTMNVAALAFGKPKRNKTHYSVTITSDEGEPVLIQTPKLGLTDTFKSCFQVPEDKVPSAAEQMQTEEDFKKKDKQNAEAEAEAEAEAGTEAESKKKSTTKPAGYLEVTCKHTDFTTELRSVDQIMMNVIREKREEWFPDRHEVIDDTFLEVGQVSSVIQAKNLIRLKYNDREGVQVFDSESKDRVCGGVGTDRPVKCILRLAGLWFTATRWGVTWSLVQVKVYPGPRPEKKKERVYGGYMFPEDDDEDAKQKEDEKDEDEDDVDEPGPPPGV
eukprot:1194161-Prorocentrum_minimum.AAC.2